MKFKFETILKLSMITMVAFFVSFACFYWSGDNYKINNFMTFKNRLLQNYTTSSVPVSFDGVTGLQVNTMATDVVVKKSQVGKIDLTAPNGNQNKVKMDTKNSTLHLEYTVSNADSDDNSTLIIALPQGVQNITINTVAGDVSFTNLDLDKLTVNMKHGDLNINDVTSKNADMDLVNGDISYFGTSSKLTAKTINGDMNINSKKEVSDILYTLTSDQGDIFVQLPTKMNPVIDALSTLGDVLIDNRYQNDTKDNNSKVNIRTVNGDIFVR